MAIRGASGESLRVTRGSFFGGRLGHVAPSGGAVPAAESFSDSPVLACLRRVPASRRRTRQLVLALSRRAPASRRGTRQLGPRRPEATTPGPRDFARER